MIASKKTTEQQGISIDGLAKEVQSMKVKIDELKTEPQPAADPARLQAAAGSPPGDPWADFLRKKSRWSYARSPPDNDRGDLLSEEEKTHTRGWRVASRHSQKRHRGRGDGSTGAAGHQILA